VCLYTLRVGCSGNLSQHERQIGELLCWVVPRLEEKTKHKSRIGGFATPLERNRPIGACVQERSSFSIHGYNHGSAIDYPLTVHNKRDTVRFQQAKITLIKSSAYLACRGGVYAGGVLQRVKVPQL
jgi:hypothetical protein